MGPFTILYIAFASISLFACILQLFISYKKNRDLLFLYSSILSCTVFAYFTIMLLCGSPLGNSCPPLTLLKIQLIIAQIVAISMLLVLYQTLKSVSRTFVGLFISIFGLFILVALTVPEHILFGEDASVRFLELSEDEKVTMIGSGFTLWRAIKDLAVVVFVLSILVMLLKKLDTVSFRTIAILFAGLGLLFFAAIFDQLVDLGTIPTSYFMPFAAFIFYSVLAFIPFFIFLDEVSRQKNIIQQGKKWQHLVNQADLIIVGLNRMGIVESANPFFYKLTGCTEDEVIGKDWFEFFIPPKEYYNVQGTFVEILEYEFHPQYINPILTKNKEEKIIRWFNVRILNQDGKINGSLSIGVDVTEEMKQKEAIQKKLKDAEKLIVQYKKTKEISIN